jgi:hypothetical protein
MTPHVKGPAPPKENRSEDQATAKLLDAAMVAKTSDDPRLLPVDPLDEYAQHVDGGFVIRRQDQWWKGSSPRLPVRRCSTAGGTACTGRRTQCHHLSG